MFRKEATGELYDGDMVVGDRLATDDELAAWEASKAPTKEQRIAALLAPVGLTQAWQVDGFMAGMLGGAALQGYTEAQLLQSNAAYKIAHDIRQQILAIQEEP